MSARRPKAPEPMIPDREIVRLIRRIVCESKVKPLSPDAALKLAVGEWRQLPARKMADYRLAAQAAYRELVAAGVVDNPEALPLDAERLMLIRLAARWETAAQDQ